MEKTVEIPLTQGKVAIIDAADRALIEPHKWYAARSGLVFYAFRTDCRGGKHDTVRMHRLILDAPKGVQVDHVNGDGLDNRRDNLRLCSIADNTRNRRPVAGSTSAYVGVSFSARDGRWCSQIGSKRAVKRYLGRFDSEAKAARVYDAAALAAYGEFASLNFPNEVKK